MRKVFDRFLYYLGEADLQLVFFLLFVFALPFSKRMEFLSPYSYLNGRFIEYTTYIIYGFDILLCIALSLWVFNLIKNKRSVEVGNSRILGALIFIVLVTLATSLYSRDASLSIYYGLVMMAVVLIYLFVVSQLKTKKAMFLFLNTFVVTMALQSVIALVQFIKNSSVGLSLLGESPLSPLILGVAKTVIGGAKHIRAYGTFSHPNILAVFLVLAGIICIYLLQNYRDRAYRCVLIALMFLISLALLLTFSRVAWILALFTWTYLLLRAINKRSLLTYFRCRKGVLVGGASFIILVALVAFFASAIWWRVDPFLETTWDSFAVREVAFLKSFEIIWRHPLGIGAGSYTMEIAYLLTGYPIWMAEPVHNSFLMIFVEAGVLAFLAFSYLLFQVFVSWKKTPVFARLIFVSLFIYMFFDHAFWDIRQAQYLMAIFIGIVVVYVGNQKETIGKA